MATKIKQSGIADLAVGQGQLAADAVTAAKIVDGAVGAAEIGTNAIGADEVIDGAIGASDLATTLNLSGKTITFPPGCVVQVVNSQDGALATGTTQMPFDDTIPQNTEGDQYLSVTITPKAATNKLKISVLVQFSSTVAGNPTLALFQDSTANALAALSFRYPNTSDIYIHALSHFMTAGTTSATTFKVRLGNNAAGTTTFNGNGGLRRNGGVAASSITIEEIAAP